MEFKVHGGPSAQEEDGPGAGVGPGGPAALELDQDGGDDTAQPV